MIVRCRRLGSLGHLKLRLKHLDTTWKCLFCYKTARSELAAKKNIYSFGCWYINMSTLLYIMNMSQSTPWATGPHQMEMFAFLLLVVSLIRLSSRTSRISRIPWGPSPIHPWGGAVRCWLEISAALHEQCKNQGCHERRALATKWSLFGAARWVPTSL